MPAPNSPTSFVFDSSQNNAASRNTVNLSTLATPGTVQAILRTHVRRGEMYAPEGLQGSQQPLRFVIGAASATALDDLYDVTNDYSAALELAEQEVRGQDMSEAVVYILVPILAVTIPDNEDDDTDF